jgi:hypothetical protein
MATSRRIPSNLISESASNRKESTNDYVATLCLLTASAAFPWDSPSVRCISANALKSIATFRAGSVCNVVPSFDCFTLTPNALYISVNLSAIQHYVFEVRLSGNVNINTNFGVKRTATIAMWHKQNALQIYFIKIVIAGVEIFLMVIIFKPFTVAALCKAWHSPARMLGSWV